MVGHPKTIGELGKLDANPRVVCRQCVWSIEYDRDALIRDRLANGRSLDWGVFCGEARCAACGTDDVRIVLRPFVSDRALGSGDMKQALVFKALCVLDEAKRAARHGRVPQTFGLRFALAYLYAVGDRSGEWFDRQPYIEFWQVATQRDAVGGGVEGAARNTLLQTNVNGIARAAGMEITADVLSALHRASGGLD